MAFGTVINCALGDRLRQEAAAGDIESLRTLAGSAPVDMPRRAALAWRDAHIRLMARGLFAAMPGHSRHGVAIILAQAGRDLVRHRGLTLRAPFDRLTDEERAHLEKAVRYVTDVLADWPRLRQIENIIGLQWRGVEAARCSDVCSVGQETEHADEQFR